MFPPENGHNVVLYGASVRAMACSAHRAGWRPLCFDLFADWDLRQLATCQAVEPATYPEGLLDPDQHPPGIPWSYMGGLENYPHLFGSLMERGPLLGNGPEVLRAVRNPVNFYHLVAKAGLDAVTVHRSADNIKDGRWLVKPVRSAAGRGIRPWDGQPISPNEYLQQFVEGSPHAAVFAATDQDSRLLGVTQQLVGQASCNAPPFSYCGSIGPVVVEPSVTGQLERLGEALQKAGLRGIFGVDFLLHQASVRPVEVNPRYTASVEVLERFYRRSAFPVHVAPFLRPSTNIDWPTTVDGHPLCGKMILFAPFECSVSMQARCYDKYGDWECEFADVPNPGTIHFAGEPVLTVFAEGSDPWECQQALVQKVTDFCHRWLMARKT